MRIHVTSQVFTEFIFCEISRNSALQSLHIADLQQIYQRLDSFNYVTKQIYGKYSSDLILENLQGDFSEFSKFLTCGTWLSPPITQMYAPKNELGGT